MAKISLGWASEIFMSLARRAPTPEASRVETDRYDKREAGPGRGHIIDNVERRANMPPDRIGPIFAVPRISLHHQVAQATS
jgi:hypothetical protein